jgi:type IV pilus assembly protein PilF
MIFAKRLTRAAFFALALVTAVLTAACATQPAQSANLNEEESARLESARLHTELGSAYYGNGQLAVALEELTIASQVYPKYAPAFYMLGLVYMDMHEDAQAEQAFKQAISLDPSSSEAYNNYGWFLCQRGKIDEAIRQFMIAVKNPRYDAAYKPYVNAGICSRKRNDDTAALEYFERALKLQPNHPQALYNSADIYFQRGDLAMAKSLLLHYMRTSNPGPDALWLGVRLERKLGDRVAQASYAQMLRQRYPEAPETQLLKAERYE